MRIICSKCGESLPRDCFYTSTIHKNGASGVCKRCISARNKEYNSRPEVKEKLKNRRRTPEEKEKARLRRQSPEGRAKRREYRQSDKAKAARKAYRELPEQRVLASCRARIARALKAGRRSATTAALTGCTPGELKRHIESKFQEGMHWGNYGFGGDKWVIDHRIPCAAFDFDNPEDIQICFHYTNLQPMWFRENLKKRDKVGWKAGQHYSKWLH